MEKIRDEKLQEMLVDGIDSITLQESLSMAMELIILRKETEKLTLQVKNIHSLLNSYIREERRWHVQDRIRDDKLIGFQKRNASLIEDAERLADYLRYKQPDGFTDQGLRIMREHKKLMSENE